MPTTEENYFLCRDKPKAPEADCVLPVFFVPLNCSLSPVAGLGTGLFLATGGADGVNPAADVGANVLPAKKLGSFPVAGGVKFLFCVVENGMISS